MSLAMTFPPELMQMILHGLSKRDLKSSRLACRHWAAQVPPLLFDTVFLIPRFADLEVADCVMEKYGNCVTTLIYSAESLGWFYEYDSTSCLKDFEVSSEEDADCLEDVERSEENANFWGDDVECSEKNADCLEHDVKCSEENANCLGDDVECSDDTNDIDSPPSAKSDVSPEHDEQYWNVYRKLSKEEAEIDHMEMVFERLCHAFMSLPRIGRVVLTHSWRKREHCWCQQAVTDAQRRCHKPWEETQACPCTGWTTSENDKCMRFERQGYCPIASADTWKQLMKALDRTGKVLQDITFEPVDVASLPFLLMFSEHQLPVNVFEESFGLVDITSTVFQNLTHLRLNLDLSPKEEDDFCRWPHDQEGFYRTLSTATNLKYLHIRLGYGYPTECSDFQAVFRCCQFPYLATLSLDEVYATAEELQNFLQERSPNVQCLHLKHFLLVDGYWMSMLQIIRNSTRVTDLRLHEVDGYLADNDGNDALVAYNFNTSPRYGFTAKILEFFHAVKGSVVPKDMLWRIVHGWAEDFYVSQSYSGTEGESPIFEDVLATTYEL